MNDEDIIELDEYGESVASVRPLLAPNFSQIKTLKDSLQQANDKISKFETNLRKLTSAYEFEHRERDYLNKKNELNEQEIEKLRKFIEENKRNHLEYINKLKNDYQEEINELRGKLKKYENGCGMQTVKCEVKSEVESSEQPINNVDKQLELMLHNTNNENILLKSEIQSLKISMNTLEEKSRRVEEKHKSSHNTFHWTQVELKRIQVENKDLREELVNTQQKLRAEINRFEANIINNEGRIRNLLKTVSKLQEENYILKSGSNTVAPKSPMMQPTRATLPIYVIPNPISLTNKNSNPNKRPNDQMPSSHVNNKHFKSI